jgi:hypothetical protein
LGCPWQPSAFHKGLRLLEKLERALFGNIAGLTEAREGLEASRVLFLADDATVLGLHEVLLHEATGRVLGSSVPDLRGAAVGGDLRATLLAHILAVLAGRSDILAILTSRGHFYIKREENNTFDLFFYILKRGTFPDWIF